MIICKEIAEYLRHAEQHPKLINEERKLLIDNIVMPTMRRNDIFFDEKTYQNCLKYCEKRYYKLFPYQKFIYAFAFMYKDDIPIFPKLFIMMGRGNGIEVEKPNESVTNLPKITAAMLKILNDLNLKEPIPESSMEDDYL